MLPRDHSARVVDDALETEFPPSRTSPIYVAAQGGPQRPRGDRALRAAARRAARRRRPRRRCSPPSGLYRIDLVGRGPALGEQAKELVRDVRAVEAPVPVRVGGQTAGFLDQQKALSDSLPIALAILATTTLVILFLMTGSVDPAGEGAAS